jgi:hypothetical protein
MVDPDHVDWSPLAPSVIKEDIYLGDQIFPMIESTKLPAIAQNSFQIRLSGGSVYRSEDCIIECQLDGLDSEWNRTNSEYFFTYKRVPPGKYVLKARAQNHEGRVV